MIIYGRRIQVTVAGLVISDPKISIEIERQPDEQSASGQAEIFNLSKQHEAQIEERGGPIEIEAGYGETPAIVYDGFVERVVRVRANLARVTRILLGSKVYQPDGAGRLGGLTSRSYRGTVSVRQIVRDIVVKDLELVIGPTDAIPPPATVRNWAWSGPADAALSDVLREALPDLRWTEQDGVIRFNRAGQVQPDAPGFTLSPDTGLIGSPAVTDDGAEALSFLNPVVQIGSVVTLESDAVSGTWKVAGFRHAGDNWDGRFTTAYDLRAL